MKTINLTPKWCGLYPLYMEWIERGNKTQKELAREEMKKLCELADRVNDEKDLFNNAGELLRVVKMYLDDMDHGRGVQNDTVNAARAVVAEVEKK